MRRYNFLLNWLELTEFIMLFKLLDDEPKLFCKSKLNK